MTDKEIIQRAYEGSLEGMFATLFTNSQGMVDSSGRMIAGDDARSVALGRFTEGLRLLRKCRDAVLEEIE